MLDRIVLHGEFSLFTVRGNFWYQIYRNRRKKVLCSRLSLITLTIEREQLVATFDHERAHMAANLVSRPPCVL